MTELVVKPDDELEGWKQAVQDTSPHPELHAIAKSHLERVESRLEISPEHHQAHIDIARPAVPDIDSLSPEEQDFVGEIIEIGEEAISTTLESPEDQLELNKEALFSSRERIAQFFEDPREVISDEDKRHVKDAEDVGWYAHDTVFRMFNRLEQLPVEKKAEGVNFAWSAYEQLAETGLFDDPDLAGQHLMNLLFIARSVPPEEGTANNGALMFLRAAEAAYAKDFSKAHELLESLPDSPKLKPILEKQLEEAKSYDAQPISSDASSKHLSALTHDREPQFTQEQLEAANIDVTVGTSMESLEAMLASADGRYLTVHEHATSGGMDLGKTAGRMHSYNQKRRDWEKGFGHNPNVFLPRPVYGALTSDLESTRSSGYGEVSLHPKQELVNNPATMFFLGDSLANIGMTDHLDTIKSRQVNKTDASVAYAHLLSVWAAKSPTEYPYVEAQLQGLRLDDIDKVSISLNPSNDRGKATLERSSKITEELIGRGIGVEYVISWADVAASTDRRIKAGASEEEVYRFLQQVIKGEHVSDSRVTVTMNAPLPSENVAMPMNEELLHNLGIMVKKPVVRR